MHDETASFELPATMKIEDCESLHAFLTSARDKDITIDCGGVTRLGGLAGQLLVAAVKSWTAKPQTLTLVNRSVAFDDGLALLGLTDMINQDQGAA